MPAEDAIRRVGDNPEPMPSHCGKYPAAPAERSADSVSGHSNMMPLASPMTAHAAYAKLAIMESSELERTPIPAGQQSFGKIFKKSGYTDSLRKHTWGR